MHNKRKYNGHNVHKYRRFWYPWAGKYYADLMYVVCPERGELIGWLEPGPNPETGENNGLLGRLTEQRLPIVERELGRHGYLQTVLDVLVWKCKERWVSIFENLTTPDRLKLFNVNKEEKKMSEIRKDRLILNENEGCYLEIMPMSNKIIFHFGGEDRMIDIPERYEMEICPNEWEGVCDLHIKKKKPKLLNMKFTVKARPIFRKKYANTTSTICDSAISFPEPYAGDPLRLVIKDGVVSTLSSDAELKAYDVGIWKPEHLTYTVDDIPLIESKIREAYNNRKIFPNATGGIEIIKEDL